MNPDLNKAIQMLHSSNYTCVLCKDDVVYTSTQRGVTPLMDLLDKDLSGFSAADKVVGKATALLYCLLGIQALHANVISESALTVLQRHGVSTDYTELVPYIVNRAKDGRCPMELATQAISDPKDAPGAIRAALETLKKETA